MSRHILVVEKDETYAERFPDFPEERVFRLECPDGNGCAGWSECRKPHTVNGKDASAGPYECDEFDPWYDLDEFTFHGVLHTWHSGFDWTVPYDGCVVDGNDWEPPDGAFDLPYGRYEVEDDWWDETSVTLFLIGPTNE